MLIHYVRHIQTLFNTLPYGYLEDPSRRARRRRRARRHHARRPCRRRPIRTETTTVLVLVLVSRGTRLTRRY